MFQINKLAPFKNSFWRSVVLDVSTFFKETE